MRKLTLNIGLLAAGLLAIGYIGYFAIWWNSTEIRVGREHTTLPTPKILPISSLTGLPCENGSQRPIAMMMASDPITRPLSGIAQADLVVEMPVTPGPNEVTRMMAVFQCAQPREIGSIRSARGDFIPLAASLKAIYGHWGGEKAALERLNSKILDNVDGLIYDGTTYFRKTGIRSPHNGFTTLKLIRERAQGLNYSLSSTFAGYPRKEFEKKRDTKNRVNSIIIPYSGRYAVRWEYNESSKQYTRFRDNTPELDKLTNEAVQVGIVAVMKTTSRKLSIDYISVKTTGQGAAVIYQEGSAIPATWKKDTASLNSKLIFVDGKGKEIPLVPGKMWIEITTR